MSGKKLLVYVAVLLVVAGGYVFSEYYHSRQADQEKQAKQIFQVPSGEITALTLTGDKGEIRLERAPAPPTDAPAKPPAAEWRVVKPINAPADELTINSLLGALAEIKLQRSFDDASEAKLKEFGLEKPIFTLEVQTGERRQQLSFGKRAPGDQNIYARKDDEPRVLLVRVPDKETLDRTLTALRSKAIFSLPATQITEVRLIRPQERLILHRTGPEAWKPGETLQVPLRTDRINALLRQLSGAKALEFVAEKPDDLKKYGLAPSPALRLTLLGDRQEETLLLGSKQGERYYAQISGKPPIFLVDKVLVEGLPASYDALEDRRLWSGQEIEIQKVVWGAPDRMITAVREKDGWMVQAPDGPAHLEAPLKGSLALRRLQDLEYNRLLPPDQGKKNAAPRFSLQLLGADDKSLFRLDAFPAEKDHLQVAFTRGEKTVGATVSAKKISELQESLGLLAAKPDIEREKSAPKAP